MNLGLQVFQGQQSYFKVSKVADRKENLHLTLSLV